MGNVINPVPLNPLAPEELRKYLLVLKRAIETQGTAVDDAAAITAIVTTETADGTYSSNEQDMLNNLKTDVTNLQASTEDIKTQLNALITSLENVGVIS
jgi:hypothetical protein